VFEYPPAIPERIAEVVLFLPPTIKAYWDEFVLDNPDPTKLYA